MVAVEAQVFRPPWPRVVAAWVEALERESP
jgi:hypothetical protein